MSISSNLDSSRSAKKLISFVPYTQNEGNDDIGSNSISKIPNDSRNLHVV